MVTITFSLYGIFESIKQRKRSIAIISFFIFMLAQIYLPYLENVYATNVIVDDRFTESSDTALTSHTPDIGTGWTEEVDNSTGGADAKIIENEVRSGESENHKTQMYSAQPNPTSKDQDISITIADGPFSATGSKGFCIFGRQTSLTSYYVVQIMPNAHSEDSISLFYHSGDNTNTELGTSVDETIAANDIIKLVLRDGSQEVFYNGVSKITASDTNLDGDIGKWGFAIGGGPTDKKYCGNKSAHLRLDWKLDDFLAE